jgi:hypothetical protein
VKHLLNKIFKLCLLINAFTEKERLVKHLLNTNSASQFLCLILFNISSCITGNDYETNKVCNKHMLDLC